MHGQYRDENESKGEREPQKEEEEKRKSSWGASQTYVPRHPSERGLRRMKMN